MPLRLCLLAFLAGSLTCTAQQTSPSPAPGSGPLPAAGDRPMGAEAAHGVMPHARALPSTGLTLTVDLRSTQLTPTDLERLPQRSITVSNGHTGQSETYSGVAVSELLARSGLLPEGAGLARIWRGMLRATGTDGYWVLFSGAEIQPTLHAAEVIVALQLNGKPLDANGRLMLVDSADKRPARWVRNLQSLSFSSLD